MNNSDLINELRISRSVITELINKAWEFGGSSVGESEFESYPVIVDAREQIEKINTLEREFHKETA